MPTPALILFAHGARDARWAEPLIRLREKIAARRPGLPVELAYLELMSPDLPTAARTLVARGADELAVVPVFLGQGGHLRRDLPAIVDSVRAEHPGVAVNLAGAVGEDDSVLERIADVCLDAVPTPR